MVQVKQEKTQLVNGEVQLSEALKSPRLNTIPVEELKQVLRLIMVKVGLRSQNFPGDIEKVVLMEHITTNYSNHTLEEIKLAFDLAISGKLDMEEVSCFENFSCLYFSNVMNSYRRWAIEQHKYIKPKELPPPTENLSDQTMMEWIEETKKELNAGNIKSIYFLPVMQYEWLVLVGKLNPTNQEKREALVKAQGYRQTELVEAAQSGGRDEAERLGKFTQMKLDGFVGTEADLLKALAKRIVLFDYLKSN